MLTTGINARRRRQGRKTHRSWCNWERKRKWWKRKRRICLGGHSFKWHWGRSVVPLASTLTVKEHKINKRASQIVFKWRWRWRKEERERGGLKRRREKRTQAGRHNYWVWSECVWSLNMAVNQRWTLYQPVGSWLAKKCKSEMVSRGPH